MITNLDEKIEEAASRIRSGAQVKKLLEEYASKYNLQDAFHIVIQAQIKSKNKQ
tara:strand:- start:1414 stop:1575 length:162 start_codon:yes stop_codon:yes gene_type:complete